MLSKILLLWLFNTGASPLSVQDTVELKEVAVYASPTDRYAVGQHISSFEKDLLDSYSGQSLGNFLQQNSGLFLRQYGEGMVASLTMRGTSAGHTAVFWNGLPVNSPSLGQSDFSIIPTEAIGNIAVHHGSSGALYGTDAIGGAVHIQSKLRFNQGHQAGFNQGIGSFGRFNIAVNYGYSNKKVATETKVYQNISRNDFSYRDLTRPGNPRSKTTNSAIKQFGFIQDFGWNVRPGSQWSTSLWYNSTDREIQPLIGSNSTDHQKDDHLRWVLDYKYFLQENSLNIKGGLSRDKMIYNVNSVNETIQYFLSADMEWVWNDKIQSKIGTRYTHVVGNLSTYSTNEDRLEIYASGTLKLLDRLAFSLNLRQALFDWEWVPFTPSLSGKWDMLEFGKNAFSMHAAISESYKIPTLNDRFWVPGGNPELEPENSRSWEVGLEHKYLLSPSTGITSKWIYYRMDVENWIIWLPQGNVWSPQNIRNVRNQGLEFFSGLFHETGDWKMKLDISYALNQAINKSRVNDNDRSYGKQLPYTPLHKFHWNWNVDKAPFRFFVGQVFTGERFETSDNESGLDPFQLWNSGLNYQLKPFGIQIHAGIHVYNLFNEQYQVMRLRAMPGRNYQLNLKIDL